MMSINIRLRSMVASVEAMELATYEPMSTIASLEEYFEQREVLDDLNRSITITASLSDAIDELQDVEDTVEVIEEGGQYGNQAVDMHLSAVNRVKELIGDEPMALPSVESRGDASSMRLVISAESKGVMAKAWDALVAFLKRIKDAIVKFFNTATGRSSKKAIGDLRKSMADGDVAMAKAHGSLVAFAEADKKQSKALGAMLDDMTRMLDETLANSDKSNGSPFSKANPKLLTTIEELDEFMLGKGDDDGKKSEAISKATIPDGDKLLEGPAKREIEGDLKIIEESDKSDETLLKKVEKMIDTSTKIAEAGKGGKAAQDTVKAAAKISGAVTSHVKNNAQKKRQAVAGYNKRQRTKKGKK